MRLRYGLFRDQLFVGTESNIVWYTSGAGKGYWVMTMPMARITDIISEKTIPTASGTSGFCLSTFEET